MKIGGLQPFTLSDYPDCCAAIIFTIGCNFRCPYCHNKILLDNNAPQIPIEKIFNFLKEKQGKLDGVVISGGEPTIQEDLFAFIQQVKELGYKIKLDTNGSNPAIIKRLLDANLLDYIAMDIKAPIPVRDARFCAPATMQVDSSSLALQQGVSAANKRSLLNINEHCEQGHNAAASQNAATNVDSSSLVLQQGVSAKNKRSLLNINEHCEQGHNAAASQNAATNVDSSSLVLQQGVSAVNKRSLLDINEHCEQGHNAAASQNAATNVDSSSLVLQQGVSAVNKRSLLDINEHCEQGHNEAASQNAVTNVDSSSLALQQGVSAANKRSLLNINEHCEQGHNAAASQNTKSLYDKLAGTNIDPTTIHNSINIIVNSKIKHIFRTTWDKTLLSEHDINAIKTFLPPNSNFVLQECQKSY